MSIAQDEMMMQEQGGMAPPPAEDPMAQLVSLRIMNLGVSGQDSKQQRQTILMLLGENKPKTKRTTKKNIKKNRTLPSPSSKKLFY